MTATKRSRAKSSVPTAINQTVLLRVEPRLKWTGSIDLVPIARGGGRAIHFAKEWEVERGFLELCPKTMLHEYAAEWKIDVPDGKRGDMIDAIMDRIGGRRGLAPRELAKLTGIRL